MGHQDLRNAGGGELGRGTVLTFQIKQEFCCLL